MDSDVEGGSGEVVGHVVGTVIPPEEVTTEESSEDESTEDEAEELT